MVALNGNNEARPQVIEPNREPIDSENEGDAPSDDEHLIQDIKVGSMHGSTLVEDKLKLLKPELLKLISTQTGLAP